MARASRRIAQAKANQQQAEAALRQAETALRQAADGAGHRDLRNKRYQESSEMLGSDVLAVRLAGIYALQRLAEDHPGIPHRDHEAALRVRAQSHSR